MLRPLPATNTKTSVANQDYGGGRDRSRPVGAFALPAAAIRDINICVVLLHSFMSIAGTGERVLVGFPKRHL